MEPDRIKLMYQLFGSDSEHKCKECSHLIIIQENKRYNKCKCYGITNSESTDWRQKWNACGLYNKEYNGNPIIDVKKHMARPKRNDEQIEGQMSLYDQNSLWFY